MQILFLVDDLNDNSHCDTLLNYEKSLTQNILMVKYDALYEKDVFIYAKEALILSTKAQQSDVLLSPSLIIHVNKKSDTSQVEAYLKGCWQNAFEAFYEKESASQSLSKLLQSKKQSHCIVYVDNCQKPNFKLFEKSIVLKENSTQLNAHTAFGIIEQAITEYFADMNYFSSIEWKRDYKIVQNQSMMFYVQFDISPMYGDYTSQITHFQSLGFEEAVQIDEGLVFDYLDGLLQYRLDRYIEQVKFRTHIIKLCQDKHIDLEPSYFKTFILTQGESIGLQRTYYGGLNAQKGIDIINDKHRCNTYLREHGFNANLSFEYRLKVLRQEEVIKDIAIPYPLTLKPTDKKEGYGVVTNIPNEKRMLVSVKKLLKLEDIDRVLVEEFFQGVTYRVLVVSSKVVAVLKFIPASIVGDGERTIEELIKDKNIISKSRVRINNALRLSIFNDDKNWETVLPQNERYIISHNSHASNGGQSTNVTALFDEKYKTIAQEACKSLGLSFAGIDMMVNDKGEYRIIEINCGPALATHRNPRHGTGIDSYGMVLNSLLHDVNLEDDNNSYLKELVLYHK